MFEKNADFLDDTQTRKIAQTRVLIVGAGALGQLVAHTLIRMGFLHLWIADGDCFEESNQNRQLYATPRTVGMKKVAVLREKLLEINPGASIRALDVFVDADNGWRLALDAFVDAESGQRLGMDAFVGAESGQCLAMDAFADVESGQRLGMDAFVGAESGQRLAMDASVGAESGQRLAMDANILVDCVDDGKVKRFLGQLAGSLGICLVHGAVEGWFGQVSTVYPGDDTMALLYPADKKQTVSALMVTVEVIAALQAAEVVKLAVGSDDILKHRIMYVDMRTCDFSVVKVKR